MKRNFIFSLAATFITAAVTLGSFTACSNEDMVADTNNPQAPTYTICIPASMGEGAQTRAVTFNNTSTPPTATGRFAASEPVYVYNETKGVMLSGVLHPSNISADGKSCNLTGDLTGTVDASDQLTLLYNMNFFNDNPVYCCFDYDGQDGSESGVVDGGMATGVSATISGGTLTTATTVTFAMQQAIFRLQFTDGTNTISVKSQGSTTRDALCRLATGNTYTNHAYVVSMKLKNNYTDRSILARFNKWGNGVGTSITDVTLSANSTYIFQYLVNANALF